MPVRTSVSPPVIAAEGISKHYGGVQALRRADFRINAGEIVGLAGANGSGKSTLLRIISGQTHADAGQVVLDGTPAHFVNPQHALAAGVTVVTQETTLVPDLTVAENVLLGRRLVRRWNGIDWRSTTRRARDVLDELRLDVDPERVVRHLRPDEKQLVEIARALSMNARVLVLDEPTSSLDDDEVDALFGVARSARERGVGIVFVSHRMRELLDLADRITVMRDGCTISELASGEADAHTLIDLMVGETGSPEQVERPRRPVRQFSIPRLEIRELHVDRFVHGVSFVVEPGEILGLAGLVGAGRSSVCSALFGQRQISAGSVRVDGKKVSVSTPRRAMDSGIAYVPSDRKNLGLVLSMSIRENLLMPSTASRWRLRVHRSKAEYVAVADAASAFNLPRGRADLPVSSLSGGNQQKVVLAKWLVSSPKVLVLDEPTRGVDVAAKGEIYRLLGDARERGLAVVVSSSETPELLALCDRIIVLFRGRAVAEFQSADADELAIARYAMGHH